MNLDPVLTPDDSGDGPGDQDRLGGGTNFEHLFGRPSLTRHCQNPRQVCSGSMGWTEVARGTARARAAARLSQRARWRSGIFRGGLFPARLGVEGEAAPGIDVDHYRVAARDLAP